MKADNSTDNSATLATCISTANSTGNTAILFPIGVTLAPSLHATISGSNIWLVCAGAPGTCVLKTGSNFPLTWTGQFGGTFNMGFSNSGSVNNTTLVISGFAQQFLNSSIDTTIGTFGALTAAGGTVTFDGTFGTISGATAAPLFAVNANGMIIRHSQIASNGTPGSVTTGRDFVAATGTTVDTIILQNNLVQILDSPLRVFAANGVVIQNIYLSGNVFDSFNEGYILTANSGGTIASFNYQDGWLSAINSPCLFWSGAGTIQGQFIQGKMGQCGTYGIISTASGTFTDVKIDVAIDGVNRLNIGGDGINLAGGAGYSNISIVNSKVGFSGVSSPFQAVNGCIFNGAIDHLTFIGNNCYGSVANYQGMAAGTSTTYAHANYKQRSNVGLQDSPASAVNEGGTGLTLGTSGGVPCFNTTTTMASSAALTSGLIMIGGGAGACPSITATGTGVLTALGINVSTVGSFVINGGTLGTPSSGVGTNLTSLNASQLSSGTVPAARTNGHQNGTATNDNAAAGEIGEFMSNTGSNIALTTGTAAQVATVTLTAGDWDVWGSIAFLPAATTTSSTLLGVVSLTSASASGIASPCTTSMAYAGTAGANQSVPVGVCRVSVATNTPVYVNIDAFFAVSTAQGNGTIFARRVR